jgi:pentatricopeptide repeat protein
VFDEMLDCGISPPPAHAVMSLLTGFAAAGDFTRGLEMLQEMKAWGIAPNLRMMSTLMHACLESGQADIALAIYAKVKASSTKPDSVTNTLLLRAYGMKGEMDRAFNVVKSMSRDDASARPNVVTYNTLIECANKHNRTDLALRALQMVLRNRFHINMNSNTFDALVCTAASINRTVRENRAHDVSLSSAPRSARHEDSAGEVSHGEDGAYVSSTIPPGGDTSMTSERYLQYLMDAVRIIREAGKTPNGTMYVALLETCETCREWHLGAGLVAERRRGAFHVGRSSAADARLFEETFRTRCAEPGRA